MLRRPSLLAALLLAASCTSTEELGNSSSGGSTSSATDDTGSTSLPDPTGAPASSSLSGGSTSDTTTSAVDSSSSDGGGSFILPTGGSTCDDLPDGVLAHCSLCDFIAQDCGQGEACKPWASDGSGRWNTSRCSPLVDEPAQRGESCTTESNAASGIDSCDEGLMCWNVDAETQQGTCVELCAIPTGCKVSTEVCNDFNDGALPVCLPACDPLASTCDDGFGCYPNGSDTFSCIREGELVHTGSVSHPECPAGQLQVAGGRIAGCEPGEFCCRSYCDTSAVDPCGADVPCISFFDEVTDGFENLGYCGA